MSSSNINYQRCGALLLVLYFFAGSVCFAGRGGESGFHQEGGNAGFHQDGGYHQDDGDLHDDGYHSDGGYNYIAPNVGNYHPGNGWVAPGVIINQDTNNTNCQIIQQCDSNNNCVQTQECD